FQTHHVGLARTRATFLHRSQREGCAPVPASKQKIVNRIHLTPLQQTPVGRSSRSAAAPSRNLDLSATAPLPASQDRLPLPCDEARFRTVPRLRTCTPKAAKTTPLPVCCRVFP